MDSLLVLISFETLFMFSLSSSQEYYFYTPACDMRKGFDGLYGLVVNELKLPVKGGSVFVFVNRSRDQLKLLHWEPGGLVLYQKRLEKGRFALPKLETSQPKISWSELVLMVEGITYVSLKKKPRLG